MEVLLDQSLNILYEWRFPCGFIVKIIEIHGEFYIKACLILSIRRWEFNPPMIRHQYLGDG